MKIIELTNGLKCFVDDEDFERVSKFNWYISNNGYARTCMKGKKFVQMHRFILNAGQYDVVDHINRNPLDNRRSNLRLADKRINSLNRGLRRDNKTGVKGVRMHPQGTYTPYTFYQGKQLSWGTYKTLDEAVAVRMLRMIVLHPDMHYEYF
jgi:hypothetical protein